jgi:hypothetical protein
MEISRWIHDTTGWVGFVVMGGINGAGNYDQRLRNYNDVGRISDHDGFELPLHPVCGFEHYL